MREIKEDKKEAQTDWDKKIPIEVSLLELQALKDTFGCSSFVDITEFFNLKYPTKKCPYAFKDGTYSSLTSLYSDLRLLVEENGGIV